MADEYIRREDALKGKKTGTFANGICLVAEPCVTVEYIESLESADVAPVVRCRECKHWALYPSTTSSNLHECKAFGFAHLHTAEMEFCSRGERKE
jgi:hypothetical protein